MMRSVKHLLLFFFVLSLLPACQESQRDHTTVTIKGELINFDNAIKKLQSNAHLAGLLRDEGIDIELDDNNQFDINFQLEEATYFSLGRNKLYLSPGDALTVSVDYMDPNKATFEGTGAEVNRYLMDVPFPKSGSYLRGGRLLKSPDITKIVALCEQRSNERLKMLEAVANASDRFKQLEKVRIKLDYINTLTSFPIYASFKKYFEYTEVEKIKQLEPVKDVLAEQVRGLDRNEYMDHPNYRDMLGDLTDSLMHANGFFAAFSASDQMKEFMRSNAFLYKLRAVGLVDHVVDEYNQLNDELANADYKNALNDVLATYDDLQTGNAAYEIVMTTLEGQEGRLSDFKGTLIYVDFWATWCGPCIAEEPAFELLKEDYKDRPVEFLSISIDTNVPRWEEYVKKKGWKEKTFLTDQTDLADYKIYGIPRYLLIDSDFKIISAFAPRPSEEKTRKMIDRALSMSGT